jgi:hypothetical protein
LRDWSISIDIRHESTTRRALSVIAREVPPSMQSTCLRSVPAHGAYELDGDLSSAITGCDTGEQSCEAEKR